MKLAEDSPRFEPRTSNPVLFFLPLLVPAPLSMASGSTPFLNPVSLNGNPCVVRRAAILAEDRFSLVSRPSQVSGNTRPRHDLVVSSGSLIASNACLHDA